MLPLTDVFFAAVVTIQESTSPMLLPASLFAIHLFPKNVPPHSRHCIITSKDEE
jgi:hypothetical protein